MKYKHYEYSSKNILDVIHAALDLHFTIKI